MRYLTPLLVLAACNTGSDVTFDANDMSTWEEVADSGQLAPPGFGLVVDGRPLRGETLTIRVSGLSAYEPVLLGVSGSDAGGPCYAYFGGVCLDITAPVRNAGYDYTDESGTFTWELAIPDGAVGSTACFQAAVRRGPGGADSLVSNTFCTELEDDRDGDGLGDLAEIEAGLDPDDPDTDGDFVRDGDDCEPLNPEVYFCTDIYAAIGSCRGSGLFRLDMDSGDEERTCALSRGYTGLTFHSDGHLYGLGDNCNGGGVYRIDTETCEEEFIAGLSSSRNGMLASDGFRLLGGTCSSLEYIDVATGEIEPLGYDIGACRGASITSDKYGQLYWADDGFGTFDGSSADPMIAPANVYQGSTFYKGKLIGLNGGCSNLYSYDPETGEETNVGFGFSDCGVDSIASKTP